jgi:hypothetical protein
VADEDCCADDDVDGHYTPSSSCAPADDCNDDPDDGGKWIYPGAAEVCGDGLDNDCDPSTPDDCATCEFAVSVSPSSVAPQSTSGTTSATVSVTPVEEVPSGGCVVSLSVEAVEYSGGHDHGNNNPVRPTGTLSQTQLTFASGSTAAQTVTYTSGEVAGTETIAATVNETGETYETSVDVKVTVLGALQSSTYYRLTGQTSYHSDNHYVEAGTYDGITGVAKEFFDFFSATLGINDASLKWGGLFDINGDWSTPHSWHRKGTSVDIDGCALSTVDDNPNDKGSCGSGYIEVEKKEIKRLCNKYFGTLVNESTIHCEF